MDYEMVTLCYGTDDEQIHFVLSERRDNSLVGNLSACGLTSSDWRPMDDAYTTYEIQTFCSLCFEMMAKIAKELQDAE